MCGGVVDEREPGPVCRIADDVAPHDNYRVPVVGCSSCAEWLVFLRWLSGRLLTVMREKKTKDEGILVFFLALLLKQAPDSPPPALTCGSDVTVQQVSHMGSLCPPTGMLTVRSAP